MKRTTTITLMLLVLLLILGGIISAQETETVDNDPRLIVMSDIGPDPDDEQTLVRLLHYANEFDIEALIVTADVNDTQSTSYPDLMSDVVNQYGLVVENLRLYDADFPGEEELLERIRVGQTIAGRDRDVFESIGPNNDTPASDFIIEIVDRDDPRPVHVTAWGGTADLAQALWRVNEDRTEEEVTAFISKLRVHAITDQDSTGSWIRETFPQLFYIFNHNSNNLFNSAFRGMYRGGARWLINQDWIEANLDGNGPLADRYPREAPGSPGVKEGDTPSWFSFYDNDLMDPAHPEWGGWGGRFEQVEGTNIYRDGRDSYDGSRDSMVTVSRWRQDFQNDFAARILWATLPPEEANENPVAELAGDDRPVVAPGQPVTFDASGSSDPDGDSLSFRWMVYPEAGTYEGEVALSAETGAQISMTAPEVDSVQTIHVILFVQDDGTPALTSYRRIIVTVDPSADAGNASVESGIELVRVMPLGDSITQSNRRHNSYRRPLWFLLQDAGYGVDFVGSMTENYEGGPPNPDFDIDHEGHWGWHADEILAEMPTWAEATQPDIVLMHLGTNDLFGGETPESTIDELGQIISVLREVNPDVVVLVATVIPHNRGNRAAIEPLNELIPTFVEAINTEQSPVVLVDQYTDYSGRDDNFDAVHPNEQGEAKMAQKWFDAMAPFLELEEE